MKMRTLLAGIVAAATMLGGMAIGASSAQADGATGTTITVNNSQSGHTYTPYKFADLKVDANDTSKVEVTTVEGWSDAVKTAAGLDDAGNNATDADKKLYASNPAAYVATFNAEQLRGFAQKLSATGKKADGTATPGTDGQSASIPVSGEGWYLVTDSFTKDGKSTTGVNAIVATTINGRTGDFNVVGDAGTGQGNIHALGQFNAKNDAPQPPTKEVKLGTVDVNGKSASVGDTLSFTINVPVPAIAAGYDEYPFTITDTASKGLKMPSTSEYKITDAAKKDITRLFTITPNGDAANGTTTTFTVTDPKNTPHYAGQTLVVTYNATVTGFAKNTEDAKNAGSVDNSATITTNNGVSGIGTTKVYNYGFSLTKKNKDGGLLKGAVFQLYDESGNSSIGSQVSTDDNGKAAWSGLAAGTYTVKETKAPAGYSQQFLPTFKVTITQNSDKTATVTIEGDTFGLATESNGDITVLNVKNVSQLPLTGAAGTAMFTVVALLVAAAGVTLAVKSRQRVH